MNTDATGNRLPLDTPGLSSARQVTSGTGFMGVSSTDLSTMVLPVAAQLFRLPFTLILPEGLDAARRLSQEEVGLRTGLISLMSFRLEPDQPTDEDIQPRLAYNFPD